MNEKGISYKTVQMSEGERASWNLSTLSHTGFAAQHLNHVPGFVTYNIGFTGS